MPESLVCESSLHVSFVPIISLCRLCETVRVCCVVWGTVTVDSPHNSSTAAVFPSRRTPTSTSAFQWCHKPHAVRKTVTCGTCWLLPRPASWQGRSGINVAFEIYFIVSILSRPLSLQPLNRTNAARTYRQRHSTSLTLYLLARCQICASPHALVSLID